MDLHKRLDPAEDLPHERVLDTWDDRFLQSTDRGPVRCERTGVTDRDNLPNRDGATFHFKVIPADVCEVYVKASLDEVVAAAMSEMAEA